MQNKQWIFVVLFITTVFIGCKNNTTTTSDETVPVTAAPNCRQHCGQAHCAGIKFAVGRSGGLQSALCRQAQQRRERQAHDGWHFAG